MLAKAHLQRGLDCISQGSTITNKVFFGEQSMLSILLVLAAAEATAAAPAQPQEKLVCKREPVTGSLARMRKICKTERQWRGAEEDAQRESQGMQDRGLINSEAPR
jgi:hypothetical protein